MWRMGKKLSWEFTQTSAINSNYKGIIVPYHVNDVREEKIEKKKNTKWVMLRSQFLLQFLL